MIKVTTDMISILIHNNTPQSFVWSSIALNIHVSILKTDYFHLWFLYKSDSCILITSETMQIWRLQGTSDTWY